MNLRQSPAIRYELRPRPPRPDSLAALFTYSPFNQLLLNFTLWFYVFRSPFFAFPIRYPLSALRSTLSAARPALSLSKDYPLPVSPLPCPK